MRDIYFVSYDGEYPNLCSGDLVLNVAGERVSADHCLTSGGGLVFEDGREDTTCGPWFVNFDRFPIEFTEEEQRAITDIVNHEVRHGCCGGCI